jgi:hypothetical protein
MQSSPPTRAWQAPASPAHSQYSIDLGALESRSGASSPGLPEQIVDRVLSEDIDGPSDFTQNLEAWMRGGTLNKKGTMNSGLHSLKETQEEGQDLDKLFVPNTTAGSAEEEHSASHHTPSNSPPKESAFESSKYSSNNEEGSSEWAPHAAGVTPQPPPHKHLLQPTVEDYWSELTPARPLSARHSSAKRRSVSTNPQRSIPNSEPSTPGRPSSDTISPVRSPVQSPELQRPMPRQFSSQSAESAFERQMQELREKCQRLETLNQALSSAIDEERRLRKQDREMYEAKLADATRREKDLTEMKNQAYEHKEDFRREFTELKSKVLKHEANLAQLKKSHTTDVQTLKQQLEQVQVEHGQEMRAVEQDLELARRSRDDAEEMARDARDDLEQYRSGRDAEKEADGDLHAQLSDIQEQLQSTIMENQHLKSAKESAEKAVQDTRAELSLLKQNREEEMKRLTASNRRVVAQAKSLQAQLKDVNLQLQAAQISQKGQTATFRNVQFRSESSEDDEVSKLRAELTAKNTALNKAILSRDALQDDLTVKLTALNTAKLERDCFEDRITTTQIELKETKARLAKSKHSSNAMVVPGAETNAKREAEWLAKEAAWKKERKTMVKGLLHAWGRLECGPPGPDGSQEYHPLPRLPNGERDPSCKMVNGIVVSRVEALKNKEQIR